jgi:hypothetical protein
VVSNQSSVFVLYNIFCSPNPCLSIIIIEPNATRNKRKAQFRVYDICLREHLHKHTWMGFIDLDEFLVLPPQKVYGKPDVTVTIPDVLKPYEEYGGLGINLRIFGSSGELFSSCVIKYIKLYMI